MAGKAAPLWTASGSTLMRWNTFFTVYLKHFCSALRGSKNGLEFRPHIFPGMCPFLSHEEWGFEALWMWDSQSRCRMSSINNINTIFTPILTQPSKKAGFPLAWPTDRSGVLPMWISWEYLTVPLKHKNSFTILQSDLRILSLTAAENKIWSKGNCPVQKSKAESSGRRSGSNSQSCCCYLRIMIQPLRTLMNIGWKIVWLSKTTNPMFIWIQHPETSPWRSVEALRTWYTKTARQSPSIFLSKKNI